MNDKPRASGAVAVLAMADQFVQLARCYLQMRDYRSAVDATALADTLTKFEDSHNITDIEWPARTESDEDGMYLAGNEDTRDGS